MSNATFVVCINNAGYEVSLEVRKIYEVLPDDTAGQHKLLRVIDESGSDYLYPQELFVYIKLPAAVAASFSAAA